MTKRLPILCLAAVLCLIAFSPPAAGAQTFEEDVKEMVARVNEAWNNRDAAALASLFAEDADLRDPNGEWVTGRDQIESYFKEWIAESGGNHEALVERNRLISEGIGVVDALGAAVPEGGSFWGEGTERFAVSVSVVQQRDGSWLFSSWRQCHSAR